MDVAVPAIEKLKEELSLLEEKVVTGYTLADAIRDGARHASKLEGGYINSNSACALGAAWIGAKARGYVPDA